MWRKVIVEKEILLYVRFMAFAGFYGFFSSFVFAQFLEQSMSLTSNKHRYGGSLVHSSN